MKLIHAQTAAILVGLFGLWCCYTLAQQNSETRTNLARTRVMLKQVACKLPVRAQPLPPITIDPEPTTLAQKNNNPLNVKRPAGGGRWKGQIGVDKFGHAIFKTQEYGIRAGALVLRSYAKKHKISTIAELVSRFAEGNHESYIKGLCSRLGVAADEQIDLVKRMPELLRAMVRQESGKELPDHYFAPYDVVAKL